MRKKDFEDAIDALMCGIAIDEMVIGSGKGNQVKEVYGHTEELYLKWDDSGRCFCAQGPIHHTDGEPVDPRRDVYEWERRDRSYDLRFE